MRIDTFSRVTIELCDEEADVMREIARLAYERIHTSARTQLSGVPLERQAGLVGPELFRVKEAIEKIGLACGISLPYEPESTQGASLAVLHNNQE